jgi:hypothetical protein
MLEVEKNSVAMLTDQSVFAKDTLVKGKPARIECVRIADQTYSIERGPLTIVRLEDEWYEDVKDPDAVVKSLLENSEVRPDIFTFWQRLPDLEPKYQFHLEWQTISALPVPSYGDWFNRQIKSRVRTSIRKSEREGVVVKETTFDDAFVQGMTEIFNEAPTRQGTKFWHYGKDFETIKRQFSRFLYREDMIGAYYEGQMIGFIMLGNTGRFGLTGQIISSIKHRDKQTNYALIAKAVEVCEKRGLAHLVYLLWTDDSLTEFKRRCGFERTPVPRYYVPLTLKGRLGLKLGLHRGWQALLPKPMKASLKRLRIAWHSRQD